MKTTGIPRYFATYAVALAVAAVPYVAVTWAVAEFLDTKFWQVLGWLLVARLFFAAVEFVGSALSWRAVGKRALSGDLVSLMSASKMPPRYFSGDSFMTYLERVKDDTSASNEAKAAARQAERTAELWDAMGIVSSFRFFAAAEAALEQYSPKVAAPAWTPRR